MHFGKNIIGLKTRPACHFASITELKHRLATLQCLAA
jgi:hypothetical protein